MVRGRCRAWSRVRLPEPTRPWRRQPPGLVHEVRLGADPHRRLKRLAGVAGVGDRPPSAVGLVTAELLAHLGIVGEPAGRQQDTLAGADQERGPFPHGADPDDAAILDDQLLDGSIGPDRDPPLEGDAQHLPDQRRAVREQRLPAESRRVGPDHHSGRDGEGAEAAVVVGERARLVRHHRQAQALGQARLQLLEPSSEHVSVKGDRFDAASEVVAALGVGVVVAVAPAVGEAHAATLEERDHVGPGRQEGMPTLEGRGRSDVAYDGLEVGQGVLIRVRDTDGPHHRIVRDPHDPARHRGRTTDQGLLLEHQCARTLCGRGQRRHHAATAGSRRSRRRRWSPTSSCHDLSDLPRTPSASEQASRVR